MKWLWTAALLFSTRISAAETELPPIAVSEVVTSTRWVEDLAVGNHHIAVATRGGLVIQESTSLTEHRVFTTLDGLPELWIERLRSSSSHLELDTPHFSCRAAWAQLVDAAETNDGGRTSPLFDCKQRPAHVTRSASLAPARASSLGGRRVTRRLVDSGREIEGTAGAGWFIDGKSAGGGDLPGPHVTALAEFARSLWVGTFNDGLARIERDEAGRTSVVPVATPFRFVNALWATASLLYVATSDGLFSSDDGVRFERDAFVEDAVVSLAFDGTSLWATTPGALYRIRHADRGPRSDVWWSPGGSRSLQKVTATPGHVWIATEDRGAIHMTTTARTRARDKPFEIFDRTTSAPSSWLLEATQTSDGAVLWGTLNQGVFLRELDGSLHPVPTDNLWCWTIAPNGDGAWIGTQGGAVHWSRAGTARITGLPDPRVHVFLSTTRAGRAGIWIGTENGLAWAAALPHAGPRNPA